jgi:ABC-type nitrate/sulfonate/bicarbonate transport system ATPase subunit
MDTRGAESPAPHAAESPAPHAAASAAPRASARKTIVFVTHDLEEAIALADEVIVLSAGPSTHVVARHTVMLDRPRDLMELRTSADFVDLHRALWVVLREEVARSQRAAGALRG